MGIKIEVLDNGDTTVLGIPDESPVVIDVMRGLPGLQNVYVSTVQPSNPVENMIWIDIS